jgi:hypothetical protein
VNVIVSWKVQKAMEWKLTAAVQAGLLGTERVFATAKIGRAERRSFILM